MANYDTLIYENVEDKIFRLTLNRPEKLNAMSQKLLKELDGVLEEFETDVNASVLIIRGAGRAFCAGYDLQGTQQPGSGFTVHSDRTNLQKMIDRWQRLFALPKPIIAQVHGFCLAGATELAGHCDIVFASEDAQFGHPAGRSLGILPTLSMWPILIGPRKTKEYFFTGDLMTAREALDNQLVNRVFPKDQLEGETLAYARRVAMVPLDLLALHKASVNRVGRPRLHRPPDGNGEELDESESREGAQGGIVRARPPIRQKVTMQAFRMKRRRRLYYMA
jgi:enoyl-CoA hydratase